MKKGIAILIMFLLSVQTVQFAFCAFSDKITASITLDEDIETKETLTKKQVKEYPFSWALLNASVVNLPGLFDHYQPCIPASPLLKKPTPPPDVNC